MQSLYLKPVITVEITNILLSLKNSATGWDKIPEKLLKLSMCDIVQSLSFISNLSLTEGVFPDKLGLANVIPLYKSDDPVYFNDYRPVSLSCILSKVFEKKYRTDCWSFLNTIKFYTKNKNKNNLDSGKDIRHIWRL